MAKPRELERIVDALDRRRRHLVAALRSREELCRAYEVPLQGRHPRRGATIGRLIRPP